MSGGWTPGWWVAVETVPKGNFVIRVPDSPLVIAQVYLLDGVFPVDANARLIAAAPDMYDALERVRRMFIPDAKWPDDTRQKLLAEADAALAKARGK